jgi:hypothetical protein
MMKTQWLGAVLAVLLVGCGDESSDVKCDGIAQAVESIREGLGNCTANFKNQEPLAFSRSTCDGQLDTACSDDEKEDVAKYVSCLNAVEPCLSTQQAAFDDAIDACLDTFQNSGTDEACIEAVVGD